MQPQVTVLMPVYNGEKYLREAMDSILNQTFTDFEFLIMNDGSTDKSVEIIESYNDPRIKLMHNEKNLGLIATLNKGLDLAKGEYIARMDCDDISLPERLEKQVVFMDENLDIGVCGTWIKVMEEDKEYWIAKYPSEHNEIKVQLLFYSAIPHPTVIIRKKMLHENNVKYDINYIHAEDYALWVECSSRLKLANLAEPLLLYRISQQSISSKYADLQEKSSDLILEKMLDNLNIKLNKSNFFIFKKLDHANLHVKNLHNIAKEILIIVKANKKNLIYEDKVFRKIMIDRWYAICLKAQGSYVSAVWLYSKIKFKIYKSNIFSYFKFMIAKLCGSFR